VTELGKHVGAAATQTPVGTTAARPGFNAVEPMAFLIRCYPNVFGSAGVQLTQPFRTSGAGPLSARRRSAGAVTATDVHQHVPQRLDNLLTSVNLGEELVAGSSGPLSARGSVNGATRNGLRGGLHYADSPRVCSCVPA
jgi:hypothetical protein